MRNEPGRGRPGRGLLVPTLMVGAIAASVVQAYRGYQEMEAPAALAAAPTPERPASANGSTPRAVVEPTPRTRAAQPAASPSRTGGPETSGRRGVTPVSAAGAFAPAGAPIPWTGAPPAMTARPAYLTSPPSPYGGPGAGLSAPAAASPAWSPVTATPGARPGPGLWPERSGRTGKSCGFGFG